MFTVDENVLNEEVKRIEEMGDPVADFLDSDEFKSVNPEVRLWNGLHSDFFVGNPGMAKASMRLSAI